MYVVTYISNLFNCKAVLYIVYSSGIKLHIINFKVINISFLKQFSNGKLFKSECAGFEGKEFQNDKEQYFLTLFSPFTKISLILHFIVLKSVPLGCEFS